MRQRITKDIVDVGGEASQYGERIHKFLEVRLAENTTLPVDITHYEPLCKSVEQMAKGGELHIEKELVLNNNLIPTGWWDTDAWFRSKLDILVVNGAEAVVMDWKTGKRKPDFFQMQIFAVQVFKHFPDVERVKTSLVWLKDMKMDTEMYTKEQASELWSEINMRIARIEKALEYDVWPARPSGLCSYCPVRHDCAFAKL